NWEVMLHASFHSKTVKKLLVPQAPVAHTLHVPSGEILPIWEVAQRYHDAGESTVLVAGERYGTGSSRDWAAKGQRLLNIRAVLALSFERIHRSNLIGMGILPLRLPAHLGPQALNLQAGDRIHVGATHIQARCDVPVTILRANGTEDTFMATAAVETQLDVDLLQCGGVIPAILQKTIDAQNALR